MTNDSCDCPLNDLREAVRDFLHWESILFGSGIVMTQEQLDTASDAFRNAKDRMASLTIKD